MIWVLLGIAAVGAWWAYSASSYARGGAPYPDVVVRYDDPRVGYAAFALNVIPTPPTAIPLKVGQIVAFVYPSNHYGVGGQAPGGSPVLSSNQGWIDITYAGGYSAGPGLLMQIAEAIGPGSSTLGAYSKLGQAAPQAMQYLATFTVSP